MEILKKKKKKGSARDGKKNTETGMKMPLMDLLVDWT